MNNRYTLPIAFAVAVHASLMFGFRPPTAVREENVSGPRPDPAPLPPKIIEVVPLEEHQDSSEPASLPKENPASNPAKLEEPDRLPADKPLFEISPPKTSAHRSDSPFFDPQPPGVPGGSILGEGGVGIIRSDLLDKPPHARVQATPDYPSAARRDGMNGEVVVEFLVDETGRVTNPSIVRSTSSVFEEPSLRAVLKWRFEPGKRDGRVVRFRMAVPVVFRLNEE